MRYLSVVHRAWWTRELSVNYIASFDQGVAEKESLLRRAPAGESLTFAIAPDPSHEHEARGSDVGQRDYHRKPVQPLELLSSPTIGRKVDGGHQRLSCRHSTDRF